MRRLALLVVTGALVLSACSDQNSDSPTEPVVPPAETFGSTCSHGRYPIRDIAALTQDADIFNTKALRAEALLRVGAIALLWDTCNDGLARKAALSTIKWINANARQNTAARKLKVEALNAAILAGFGGSSTSAEDFASDVYFPHTTKIITTPSGKATIKLIDGAFNEPTLITVRRLPNEPGLTGVPEGYRQEPPYWDYDATNSSTNNTLATHKVGFVGAATIAFCFREPGEGDGGEVTYPGTGASIGHNPVGGGFEFVTEVAVTGELQDELHGCNVETGMGRGLPGFGRYLGSMAMRILLPEPLYAAVVGPRGPIAGTPISLSPFGIVIPTNDLGFTEDGDPSERDIYGSHVQWGCGIEDTCYPTVRLTDGESGVSGETITVELVSEGGTGHFTESEGEYYGSTTTVDTDETGRAVFDNLEVTGPFPGDYRLKFSGGGASITSEPFTMNDYVIY